MEATPARRGTRPMNINAAVDCGRRQNCFQIPGEFSSSGPAAASTDKHFNVAGSVISVGRAPGRRLSARRTRNVAFYRTIVSIS